MELELSRVDYTVVGVTSKNCMKLLPRLDAQEQQKVCIADNDGILQLFSIKKEDINLHFKTLPGPQITSLQLGGEIGTVHDKIFVSSANEVRGYTRKGKLFLSFDTNMTETVTSMCVFGNDLFLCGKHIYNHYKDCKDIGSYLCGDCIVDVIALYSEKNYRLVSLIACEGRMIRALEHARVTLSMEVESAPTVLHIYENDGKNHILFGTVDGHIGILDIERLQSFSRWLINNDTFSSSIACIESYDLTGDGIKNLIIGRDDGNIEVYAVNIDDSTDIPALIYSHNCNESVTALQCGIIGHHGHDEILVVSYTGRTFGLTTQPMEKNVQGDSTGGSYIFSADTSQKVIKLRNEVDELQYKVSKEREKYQTSTQSYLDEQSAIPLLTIKDSMSLSKADASYILFIEVPTAIDNILLQSDVPIDLLDVEKNSAVVSYSDSEPQNGNYLLATYRCQINTNRIELKIRTIEGQYGTLKAYVTPLIQPKCCQVREYEIKPLSLHIRVHSIDEKRPYNILTLKGNFSLPEIHSWIYQCFPEVPEKPQVLEKPIFYFQSTFLDTLVSCTYIKGEAIIKSDNISTISVLKEFLTKEATKKKIKIDINITVNDESIVHVLQLIDPKLTACITLSKKLSLIEALQELGSNDNEDIGSLSQKYKDLLANEKLLKFEFNSQPAYLDRLYDFERKLKRILFISGSSLLEVPDWLVKRHTMTSERLAKKNMISWWTGVITDVYIDYHKFKGIGVKSKIPKLVDEIENYTYDSLVHFFRPDLQES